MHPFYPFMKSAQGNWRNALFVRCDKRGCVHKCCGAFLMTAAANGVPLLVPVDAFEAFAGEFVAPEECCGILDKHAFASVFGLAFQWRTCSPEVCPLKTFCSPICMV